jgi:flagellar protein FlaG
VHQADTKEAKQQLAPPVEAATAINPADLRLIIDEVGSPGNYLYTVMDQRTGKILSQFPREQLIRLKEQSNYTAGAVFDGKA